MTTDQSGASKGLLASLGALAATVVGIAHTRLMLLSIDLEEERERFLRLLMLWLATLFFFGIAIVLACILLVVAFWDTHRLWLLGSMAGFFLLASMVAWSSACRKVDEKSRLFATTLSELAKDRQHLAP